MAKPRLIGELWEDLPRFFRENAILVLRRRYPKYSCKLDMATLPFVPIIKLDNAILCIFSEQGIATPNPDTDLGGMYGLLQTILERKTGERQCSR